MTGKKVILKDSEDLTPDALKKATGGRCEPVIDETKDITDNMKEKA